MFPLIKDQRQLIVALRGLVAFYDGVAPLPIELAGLSSGVSGASARTVLTTAILEVLDDYERSNVPQIATSIRSAANGVVQ